MHNRPSSGKARRGGPIIAGGGGGDVPRFQSGQVQAGGMLTDWQTAFSGSAANDSYGAVAVSNQIYMLGGNSGAPVANRQSGLVLAGGLLNNINNVPGDLATERALMGEALGSARIFLVGGDTLTGPTDTVETMVW